MFQTLKEYWEDFFLLPAPIKNFIYLALIIALSFGVISTAKDFQSKREIKKLEKQNFELNRQANDSESRAQIEMRRADGERTRADNLENDLKLLDDKINDQDENLQKTHTNSVTLRRDLDVRRQNPRTNTSADDLERRLENRQRQSKNH